MLTWLPVEALPRVASMVHPLRSPRSSSFLFVRSAHRSRARSTHSRPWNVRLLAAPPRSGSSEFARLNHSSGPRSMPSFRRSENIRCA